MPLILALLILVAASLSAQTTIPTLLTPEQPVAEPNIGPIPGGSPDAIATDGTNFLIDSTAVVKFNAYGRWAMLVDAQGQPLLKTSIALGPSAWFGAGIASSGHEYLLTYANGNGRTNALRIDHAGNLLDPKPLELPGSSIGAFYRVVVWDGGQFVILRPDMSGVIAMRVSESGELLQDGIHIASGFANVAAAAANGVTVIVWSDGTGTHFCTMNAAGVLGPTTDVAAVFASIDAAAGADGFVLRIATKSGTLLQHLSPAGQPDAPAFSMPAVRLVSAGANYLVVLASSDGTQQAVHINGSGAFLDAPRTIPALPAPNALIAATATDAVVTWSTAGATTYDPWTTFDRALDSSDAVQTHRAYATQIAPRVTWRGATPVVSWTEDVIREQTVGAADVRTVSTAGDIELAVASGPSATLHIFQRGTPGTMRSPAQYTLFVQADGGDPVVVDPTVASGYTARAVWTGRDFIVVWIRSGGSDITGARIGADGRIVNGPTLIATGAVQDMALGASNSSVLFVWKDLAVAHGVLLTPSGEVTTDDVTTLTDLQYQATSFSIASDGQNFLVTWVNKSHTSYPSNDWIGGKLMVGNGHIVTQLQDYSPGGDAKTIAATFWTGSNYLTIWEAAPGVISAVRVDATGKLLDYPPVHIGEVEGDVTSIARAAAGPIVIAYTRSAVPYTPPVRAYTRFIVFPRERSVRR